jgi:hypothetical protein
MFSTARYVSSKTSDGAVTESAIIVGGINFTTSAKVIQKEVIFFKYDESTKGDELKIGFFGKYSTDVKPEVYGHSMALAHVRTDSGESETRYVYRGVIAGGYTDPAQMESGISDDVWLLTINDSDEPNMISVHPKKMTVPRAGYEAVALPDKSVILAGGKTNSGISGKPTDIGDKVQFVSGDGGETWTMNGPDKTAGNMVTARYQYTANLLGSGMILYFGGIQTDKTSIDQGELFNPAMFFTEEQTGL